MIRRSYIQGLFICLSLSIFVYAGERDRPASGKIYFGVEQGELLQNNYRDIGIRNFTFLAGQRFAGEWERFGWRALVIHVELSQDHLSTNNFIEGNRDNMSGKLHIERLYADYYPVREKPGKFVFTPILSAGLGYNYEYFINQDTQLETDFGSICFPIGFRLNYRFFNTVFLELPVIDISFHPGRDHTDLGGTLITYPACLSVYLFINAGITFSI